MKNFQDSDDTSLVGGETKKTSLRIDAIGALDELNASVGLARAAINDKELKATLTRISETIFSAGADLASLSGKGMITPSDIVKLEDAMKKAEAELPPLQNFILPGQTQDDALLHSCRASARKAERAFLRLSEKETTNREVFRYLNRLSDLFFALARLVNKRAGIEEHKWKNQA
ncbi:MAG: cob(I)yrinic acid a,c-diamide adenosyltransferase [Candidatus Aenigmarchaeota archaeon]|nr:cob(I)yrinic acid a,c-diamide adenosyltransferase [Candidatus Aenigmarchaeota archaeon]